MKNKIRIFALLIWVAIAMFAFVFYKPISFFLALTILSGIAFEWAVEAMDQHFDSQNIYVVEEYDIANFFSKIVFITTNKSKADAYVFAQKSEPYRWHKLVIWKDGEEKC